MSLKNVKVAIGDSFFDSLFNVPASQKNKVRDFIKKFRNDPASPGINYEKIHKAKDPNIRSVRIDQTYRGIILKPQQGNVYFLLWVDHHDAAYKWAENKVLNINPGTGGIQVVQMDAQVVITANEKPIEEGPLTKIRDRHLVRLGIPEAYLAKVKMLKDEAELDSIKDKLPAEAYEALYYLLIGEKLDDVLTHYDRIEEAPEVNTEDFATALENEDSKRRFYVVENETELEEILSASLEKWRIFLHPTQRKLVQKTFNGPARLTGGAGTGKTVVAMHRAAWLARNFLKDEKDRILFTTFTKNLAADINENLKKICSPSELEKIEVVNLDAWVWQFLKDQGLNFRIVYEPETDDLFYQAIESSDIGSSRNLDSAFLREEWEQVVQAQGITQLEGYIKASRRGRGIRLSRTEKRKVWNIFEAYRHLLDSKKLLEPQDVFRIAAQKLTENSISLPYKAIVIDESQDMGSQAFTLLKAMAPEDEKQNNLFIVGDANQRIYKNRVILKHCGINIVGRSCRLRINYRTTEEIRRWAVKMLGKSIADNLDGDAEQQSGYKSLLHGREPVVKKFANLDDELEFLNKELSELTNKDATNNICVVCRNKKQLDNYEKEIKALGFKTYRIKRSRAEDRQQSGIRFATMHRIKGLEFDYVFIAGANHSVIPLKTQKIESVDATVKANHEKREKALLYVAATRAKKALVISSYGKASRFLGD
ncbi:3'-5' exonuclease [Candidatus Riflebacteria bacterium]